MKESVQIGENYFDQDDITWINLANFLASSRNTGMPPKMKGHGRHQFIHKINQLLSLIDRSDNRIYIRD